jgi:hypothetical protein
MRRTWLLPLLALCTVPAPARAACPEALRWRRLQAGVAYAMADVACAGEPAQPVKVRDRALHLVRLEPAKVRLRALMTSALEGQQNLTAAQWAHRHRLALVINLGMYQNDHKTHVGHLRAGAHVNSKRWVPSYRSVLAFHPRQAGIPRAVVLDREDDGASAKLARYGAVAQNLRLIRGGDKPRGVWSSQPRRWSEAALAQDEKGRLLLLFARAPLTMWELNRLLLALPLGVVRAMHLEGGPEASLSIHAGGVDLDLCGSFETGFVPDDSNTVQWPLPNVLGVERR